MIINHYVDFKYLDTSSLVSKINESIIENKFIAFVKTTYIASCEIFGYDVGDEVVSYDFYIVTLNDKIEKVQIKNYEVKDAIFIEVKNLEEFKKYIHIVNSYIDRNYEIEYYKFNDSNIKTKQKIHHKEYVCDKCNFSYIPKLTKINQVYHENKGTNQRLWEIDNKDICYKCLNKGIGFVDTFVRLYFKESIKLEQVNKILINNDWKIKRKNKKFLEFEISMHNINYVKKMLQNLKDAININYEQKENIRIDTAKKNQNIYVFELN